MTSKCPTFALTTCILLYHYSDSLCPRDDPVFPQCSNIKSQCSNVTSAFSVVLLWYTVMSCVFRPWDRHWKHLCSRLRKRNYRDGSLFKDMYCSFRDMEFNSHFPLTTPCNSSSRWIWSLWPQRTPALMCAYCPSPTRAHTLSKIMKNKFKDLCKIYMYNQIKFQPHGPCSVSSLIQTMAPWDGVRNTSHRLLSLSFDRRGGEAVLCFSREPSFSVPSSLIHSHC